MNYKTTLVAGVLLVVITVTALISVCYLIISPYQQHVVSAQNAPRTRTGIVFGAGIRNGEPYDELKARLDSGADALDSGIVDELILSGDNRFVGYNEPEAMMRYLIDKKGVSAAKLIPDYAGRSTYETCERASKVFSVNKAILFTAGSHLPRAIYLCRHFNVEAYGIASTQEANNSQQRELFARVKAIYNTYLVGEATVLGDPN